MKKIFTLTAILAALSMIAGLAFAQYAASSIPDEEKVRSIEQVEITRKVRNAQKLIEEKGEAAFEVFYREDEKWLGPEGAIYIIHATKGDEEGQFIVYPPKKTVGKGAFEMSKVNGKEFARRVLSKIKKKAQIWYGFIAGQSGKVPAAHASATSPSGKTYVIAASSRNLAQEKHFLMELVNAACDIIAINGEKAFPVFLDEKSIFRFKNTYVFVMDTDSKVIFDPGQPEYEGHKITELPDVVPGYILPAISNNFNDALELATTGEHPRSAKEFMKAYKKAVFDDGQAWSAYLTAKPGKKPLCHKVSYHKVVKGPDGKIYVVGCGVYLATPE